MTHDDQTKKSSTQMVLDAAEDLHAREQVITRETVAELTGLKLSVIDDRLGVLVDDGKLRRVLRGVFEPVTTHPPARPMSKTILPDGRVKIEIGDDVLTLTPREDRRLASLQAGVAGEVDAIGMRQQAVSVVTEMSHRLRTELARELRAELMHSPKG